MFNLSYVRNPLSETRFIIFFVLLLVPHLLYLLYFKIPSVTPYLIFFASLIMVYWVYSWSHYFLNTDKEYLIEDRFVPHNSIVSTEYEEGPPVHTEDGLLLSPPEWEEPKMRDDFP
jgi:hypothetical protein